MNHVKHNLIGSKQTCFLIKYRILRILLHFINFRFYIFLVYTLKILLETNGVCNYPSLRIKTDLKTLAINLN